MVDRIGGTPLPPTPRSEPKEPRRVASATIHQPQEPIDTFERPGVHKVILYIGANDIIGAQIEKLARDQGFLVEVRDTSTSPLAKKQHEELMGNAGIDDMNLPVLDSRLAKRMPFVAAAGFDWFVDTRWSWLAPVLHHATGNTKTEDAVPKASANRKTALERLRQPHGTLPSARSAIFGGKSERAFSSAWDQTIAAGSNIAEGTIRVAQGENSGQMFAGYAQLPFIALTLPVAAIETLTGVALDGLLGAYEAATGFAKFMLALALALSSILLVPLRMITFVFSSLVFRPLGWLGQIIAEAIANTAATRTGGYQPAELHGAPWHEGKRSNEGQPQLADPEAWLTYFSDAGATEYRLPPPIVRQMAALRETDSDAYDQLRRELADAEIQCFYRFPSLDLLQATLRNRDVVDDRPLALVCAGADDHNRSFSTLATTVSQLSQTHRVVYVEAIDDVEVDRAMARYGSAQVIATLVVAGHGTEESVRLGSDFGHSFRQELDVRDDDRFAYLAQFLAKDATISLEACSTGNKRTHGENVAQMLARIWPGRTVWAPGTDARNTGYELGPDGKVIRVKTDAGDAIRYWRSL
jgi:hypothetical protein